MTNLLSKSARPTAIFAVLLGPLLGVGIAEAQNPIGGVIRPVPGSRPLAIQTPTVGLSGLNTAPNRAVPTGRESYNRDYYRRAQSGYLNPYAGLPYPGFYGGSPYFGNGFFPGTPIVGTVSTGVGLSVGPGGGISAGFSRQTFSPFVGGFVPGSLGGYRYGYNPFGYSVVLPAYGRYGGFYRSGYGGAGYAAPLPTVGPLDAASGMRAARPVELSARERETLGRVLNSNQERSSLSQLERSLRLLNRGDQQFRQGQNLEAKISYRGAIRAAREITVPYLHLGMVEIADGNYGSADTSFRQGLQANTTLWDRGFRLEKMYPNGANSDAFNQQLDSLAKIAFEEPDRAELHFLLGLMLHFGEKQDQASTFFDRAILLDESYSDLVAARGASLDEPIILRGDEPADR